MISNEQKKISLKRLAMMKFFPTDEDVIAEVAKVLDHNCEDDPAAHALVSHMVENYDQWPGPAEMLRVWRDKVKAEITGKIQPCRNCIAELPGNRYQFVIIEQDGTFDGKELRTVLSADGSGGDVYWQEVELKAEYPRPKYEVRSEVGYCACAAGIWKRQARINAAREGRQTR